MILGLGYYFKSLVFPYPFQVYFEVVPKDITVIVSLILGFAVFVMIFKKFPKSRVWIVLLVANLLLHLTVVGFEKAPSVLFYRYMALSISALIIVVAVVFRREYIPVALVLAVVYGIYSYEKADTWRSNLDFWRQSYKTNPENPTVLLNYGASLLYAGNSEGLNMLLKVFKGNYSKEDRFDAAVNIMVYYYNNGMYDRCAQLSEKISKLGENDLYYYIGALCYTEIGKVEMAKNFIEMAVKKYPNRSEIQALAKNLGVLK